MVDPDEKTQLPTKLAAPTLFKAERIGVPDSLGRQRVAATWRDNSVGETSFRLKIRTGPNAFSYLPATQLSPQGSILSHSIATKGENYRQVILRVPYGRNCFRVVATEGPRSTRSADDCVYPDIV